MPFALLSRSGKLPSIIKALHARGNWSLKNIMCKNKTFYCVFCCFSRINLASTVIRFDFSYSCHIGYLWTKAILRLLLYFSVVRRERHYILMARLLHIYRNVLIMRPRFYTAQFLKLSDTRISILRFLCHIFPRLVVLKRLLSSKARNFEFKTSRNVVISKYSLRIYFGE